jgi:exonuclease I
MPRTTKKGVPDKRSETSAKNLSKARSVIQAGLRKVIKRAEPESETDESEDELENEPYFVENIKKKEAPIIQPKEEYEVKPYIPPVVDTEKEEILAKYNELLKTLDLTKAEMKAEMEKREKELESELRVKIHRETISSFRGESVRKHKPPTLIF